MENHQEKTPKRKIVAGKQIKTYVHLFKAANLAIKNPESSKENDFYNSMSCILFCAFAIEAYLNHVGAMEFQYWGDDLESLNPKAKLRLIAGERIETTPNLEPKIFSPIKHPINISIDFSRRPFQSFTEIFRVRNDLAHGKTELKFDDYPNKPLAKWEKLCNLKQAKIYIQDTEQMINFIHSRLNPDVTQSNHLELGVQFFGEVVE
jgi:hypothetical protein